MRDWRNIHRGSASSERKAARILRKPRRPLLAAVLFVVGALAAVGQNPATPGGALRTDRIDLPTPINQPPDAVEQTRMMDRASKTKTYAAANAERRRRITEGTAKLLKLAGELKSELRRATDEPLFPDLVRKLDEMETTAHNVKEEMELTVRAN